MLLPHRLAQSGLFGVEGVEGTAHYSRDNHAGNDHAQDGRKVGAKVLIGADGNLSAVRKQLLNDGLQHYAGLAVWRAMGCAFA
jgi:2-polyprenyl-6-methoxyphenol hydroxylase-like FAD-dependent oxidoreductase